MTQFLVELYVARTDLAAFDHGAERARLSAEELTRQGTPVRYLHSIFVPEDETCFHLYEAASAESVREAARRAALPCERVREAVSEAPRVRARPGEGDATCDEHDSGSVKPLTEGMLRTGPTRLVRAAKDRSAVREECL